MESSWLDPEIPWLMMRLICSGTTFTFSFSSVKSGNCDFPGVSTDPGFLESGDEVELEPGSSPELSGNAELSATSGFLLAAAEVTVFRRRMLLSSSFSPLLKFSFANSHLSGTIFLNP
nr:hypothetical protein Iba_chr11aCG6110 [Ipomoea batatas]GMD51766.1 hypothetical protein Iba_chr11bCG5450 [Ipomoea batatas]GMD56813.1 hypothetical protein Iba_chr11eCG6740 [Ipomoea batatas]GMD58646.1 hypothetical protein Iba_chr11fCG7560 [Ipomoea batatas]